ncbi:hypothetical protein KI387_014228, partial [Taxus chinensis]
GKQCSSHGLQRGKGGAGCIGGSGEWGSVKFGGDSVEGGGESATTAGVKEGRHQGREDSRQ